MNASMLENGEGLKKDGKKGIPCSGRRIRIVLVLSVAAFVWMSLALESMSIGSFYSSLVSSGIKFEAYALNNQTSTNSTLIDSSQLSLDSPEINGDSDASSKQNTTNYTMSDTSQPSLVSPEINGTADAAPNEQNATNSTFMSPWYGWQPEIHPQPDCSWRKCFQENHGCNTTCRDEPDAMGHPPSSEEIPPDWVPDVTILRRMFLAQQDANGNPWPPPLPMEMCEPMGDSGDENDQNKAALDAVPIVGELLTGGGPKVLCMIYTMANRHAAQVRAIRETWAGGCDGFLAFSTQSDPRIPAISIPHDGEEAYHNMWQKSRSIWRFVDQHYSDDFDFFILGGDDLFILPQNLRSFLANVGSPDANLFAGRPLRAWNTTLYNSGGAGYTLSRGTLKQFVRDGLNDTRCSPDAGTSAEDIMVAECLRQVFNISLATTRDDQGRERFHPFSPGWHYQWRPGNSAFWFDEQVQDFDVKVGAECCAPDSVSFHYMRNPASVRHLYSLLYDSKCRDGAANKTM